MKGRTFGCREPRARDNGCELARPSFRQIPFRSLRLVVEARRQSGRKHRHRMVSNRGMACSRITSMAATAAITDSVSVLGAGVGSERVLFFGISMRETLSRSSYQFVLIPGRGRSDRHSGRSRRNRPGSSARIRRPSVLRIESTGTSSTPFGIRCSALSTQATASDTSVRCCRSDLTSFPSGCRSANAWAKNSNSPASRAGVATSVLREWTISSGSTITNAAVACGIVEPPCDS